MKLATELILNLGITNDTS